MKKKLNGYNILHFESLIKIQILKQFKFESTVNH